MKHFHNTTFLDQPLLFNVNKCFWICEEWEKSVLSTNTCKEAPRKLTSVKDHKLSSSMLAILAHISSSLHRNLGFSYTPDQGKFNEHCENYCTS